VGGHCQVSKFGCAPALFSGEDRNLADVKLVLLGKTDDQDPQACAFKVTPEAEAKYRGNAIMVMRGSCSYEKKWGELKDLGPAAMIVVDDRPGAFPVVMEFGDGENWKFDLVQTKPNGVGYPVCMTFYEEWERFARLSNVRLSFNYYAKYSSADDLPPRNEITAVQISRMSGLPQSVPVAQATFNPQILNATKAHAFVLDFDPLCRAFSNTGSLTKKQCAPCLLLKSNFFQDAASLQGKIAIVKLDPDTGYCFEMMYEIVVRAQREGAVGFMLVNPYDKLFSYLPYQVPVSLTIPFVNVMNTYGTALIQRIETGQDVELTLPPFTYANVVCDYFSTVCISSGPAAILHSPRMLGPTGIMVLTTVGESLLIEAGQANFNPPSLQSVEEPSAMFAVNASIEYAEFNAACAAMPDPSKNENNPCEACYSDLNAALLNRAAIAGKIVLVRSVQVRCIASYQAVVDVLAANAAIGVLVGSASDSISSMYAETDYISSIPAFIIKSSDTDWIRERLSPSMGRRQGVVGGGKVGLHARMIAAGPGVVEGATEEGGIRAVAGGGGGVRVLLPKIQQGEASAYCVISGKATEDSMLTTRPSQVRALHVLFCFVLFCLH